MDKKKISERRKKSLKKSMQINGVKVFKHNPHRLFKNTEKIKTALAEALLDGDKDAFIEILSGYVRSCNILEVCKRTQLSRTVVYESIRDNGNPSLETLCKILVSFRQAA